jgi:hypothetical protein
MMIQINRGLALKLAVQARQDTKSLEIAMPSLNSSPNMPSALE